MIALVSSPKQHLPKHMRHSVHVQACFDNIHALCSWIINNQRLFLGWTGSLSSKTIRGCGFHIGIENINGKSNCTRFPEYRPFIHHIQEHCYCNDDLCNTGNWDRELSYLLMGIMIGFQIVINCLVVWKYIALSKAWF